jgi:protoheme IX farnesyltransferase
VTPEAVFGRKVEPVWVQFVRVTKPRVAALAVFTAVIGMLLAESSVPALERVLVASVGIWLLAAAGFALNCLVERHIDARMARTRARPTVVGSISDQQIILGALLCGAAGSAVLYLGVNVLTLVLTLATFVGYAIVYTLLLKPATPQNIVIGGASGAMPPILGWTAIANDITFQPLLLFLIIFAWTPPHFWALALYRRQEYASAGVPMLPVTHGEAFTRLQLLLYTLMMTGCTLLPFATGMSGWLYLLVTLVLDAIFLSYAVRLLRNYSDSLAKRTFAFSIVYLALLFAGLVADHYLPLVSHSP